MAFVVVGLIRLIVENMYVAIIRDDREANICCLDCN